MLVRSQFDIESKDEPIHFQILDTMSRIAKGQPEKKAYINAHDADDTVTFKEAHQRILSVASYLHDKGYRKGDVMGVVLHNGWQYPVSVFGSWSAGLTTTSPLPFSTAAELSYFFINSNTKVVICDDVSLKNVLDAAKTYDGMQEVIVVRYDRSFVLPEGITDFDQLLSHPATFDPFTLKFDVFRDVVNLPYSSGTTGVSKGVMWTHKNISHMMTMIKFDRPHYDNEVDSIILPGNLASSKVFMLTAAVFGNTLVIFRDFEEKNFLESVQRYKIERTFVYPLMMKQLNESPLLKNYDLSSLTKITSGGAAVSAELISQVKENMGLDIITGFGMTESSGYITVRNPGEPTNSIGRLFPGIEMKIINPETGAACDVNEEGVLWFKGHNICIGYLNKPEANAEAFSADGFMNSGDIGYVDRDGYIYLKGRQKEMIAYHGWNISPAELENLVLEIEGVLDCGVIGIPDEKTGEAPRAYVSTSRDIHPNEIHEFINERVSEYKQLSGGIEFVLSIPRNSSGKVLRRKLVEVYEKNQKKN